MEYCTQQSVERRLTARGVGYYINRDKPKGSIQQQEIDDYLASEISSSGTIIDCYMPLSAAYVRSQQIPVLATLCVDITVYRIVTQGGDEAPESLRIAYESAMDMLKQFQRGLKIEGLVMPSLPESCETPYGAYVQNVW